MWDRFKARLVCDLSKSLVNEKLPHWDVKYGSVDLAVSRLSHSAWLYVVDLADAFYNWKVSADDTWMLGFYSPTRRQYGRYLYFPFGLSTAPAFNDASVKEVLRLLQLHRA